VRAWRELGSKIDFGAAVKAPEAPEGAFIVIEVKDSGGPHQTCEHDGLQ
jgi:hypothetical protein